MFNKFQTFSFHLNSFQKLHQTVFTKRNKVQKAITKTLKHVALYCFALMKSDSDKLFPRYIYYLKVHKNEMICTYFLFFLPKNGHPGTSKKNPLSISHFFYIFKVAHICHRATCRAQRTSEYECTVTSQVYNSQNKHYTCLLTYPHNINTFRMSNY